MYQPYRPPQQRPQQQGAQARSQAPPPPRPPQAIRPAAPAAAPNFQQRASMPAPKAPSAGQAGLRQDIQTFARQGLANPTRFDSSLVKQGIDVANRDLVSKRTEGMRNIEEMASRRGIVGSSTELDTVRNLERDLQDVYAKRLLDLNLEQARTYQTDRGLASQQAIAAGDFDRGLDRDLEDDLRYRSDHGLAVADRENSAAMERALFDLTAGQQEFAQGLESARFGEDATRYRANFGEDQFRFDAGQQLDRERLGESSRQFGATLDQNESQFSRNFGLEQERLSQQQEQFLKDLGLRTELGRADVGLRGRALDQDESQFGRSLSDTQAARDLQNQQFSHDAALREKLGLGELDVRGREADARINQEVMQMILGLLPFVKGQLPNTPGATGQTPGNVNPGRPSTPVGGGGSGGGGGGNGQQGTGGNGNNGQNAGGGTKPGQETDKNRLPGGGQVAGVRNGRRYKVYDPATDRSWHFNTGGVRYSYID